MEGRVTETEAQIYQSLPEEQQIEVLEMHLFEAMREGEPEVRHDMTHLHAPPIYWREIKMYAGQLFIGRKHTQKHLNVVMTGKAHVWMDGHWELIDATGEPIVFVSEAGVRKVLRIVEDMRWATIHYNPDDLRGEELKDFISVKSIVEWDHENKMRELQEAEPCQS